MRHQMTVGGRSDDFNADDLIELGKQFDVNKPQAILEQTVAAFSEWPALAKKWGVAENQIKTVSAMHRLNKQIRNV